MKKTKYCLIACLLILGSCISSIHPIYHPEDLLQLKEVVGDWQIDDDIWSFEFYEEGSFKGYQLTHREGDDKTSTFYAGLVKLGDHYFFDFYPMEADLAEGTSSLVNNHLVTTHTFMKVRWTKDQLFISQFEYDFLKEVLSKNQLRIKHEVLNSPTKGMRSSGDFLLTASTDDLKKFLTKYGGVEKAFEEEASLTKITRP